jgi:flagellar basal-body rod modification protein FlgD
MTVTAPNPTVNSTVPPASTGTGSSSSQLAASASSNYQDFLQLLTTQLKNQDPTDPTNTDNLTQEIASLSQVQEQISTNTNLQSLITLMTNNQTANNTSNSNIQSSLQSLLSAFSTTQYSNMAGDIGKEVDATGNSISVQGGQGVLAYNLPANASSAQVNIMNSAGQTVFTGSGPTVAGRNEVAWGGLETNGTQAPDGTYTFSVVAKDAAGNPLTATTYTTGVVTSADTSNGTTSLSIGGVSVPFSSIVSIRQPAVAANNSTANTGATS